MVIFLHGIGGNKKNWEGNLPFFSKKFLSVAWDTRGYGESEDYSGDFILALELSGFCGVKKQCL